MRSIRFAANWASSVNVAPTPLETELVFEGAASLGTDARAIVLTGPPYAAHRDKEFAEMLAEFPGRKIICGGTTGNFSARFLVRK